MPNVLPPDPLFTTAQARAAGCSVSALKHATKRGRVERVRPRVYARTDAEVTLPAERAAALAYAGTPLSHVASARTHGRIPLVGVPKVKPEMTVPPRANGNLPGVHVYRARLRPHDLVVVDGILVTSLARTVLDLARDYSLRTSVPALDFVLHEGLVSPDELLDVLDFCRGWPRVTRARRALELCDSRSESPLESISRLIIPELGLPSPEPQVIIRDLDGRFVARTDLYWDQFGVVGEADGRGKYVDGEIVFAEKDRHEDLDDLHLEITRWGWQRVWFEPALLRQRISAAFERGAERDRSGVPRLWEPASTARIAVL